jgi:hypothetical protein
VVCPNPFYQIYEGAALLAGAALRSYAPSDPARNFAVDWSAIDEATWARTQLLYVCSPGNPTGAVMPLAEWEWLFALSDRHGFVIASDECYSEIWFGDAPPLGGLQAAQQLGRHDFRRLVTFTSLSKRSNVPGLRSGFVAGDAALLKAFLLYRTYHGSAMSPMVQAASIAAWNDEAHVQANRALYRAKFAAVTPMLARVLDVALPGRRVLPLGRRAGRRRHRWARAACSLNTMWRCCRAACWRARHTGTTPGPAACAWPSSHRWRNAPKPPGASFPTSKAFHEHGAAIDHRPRLGQPRQLCRRPTPPRCAKRSRT